MAEKAVKKKPNIFKRMGAGISKFFRDFKSEIKKITWPTKKQVFDNLMVVLAFIAISAVFIILLDLFFGWGINKILDIGI